MLDLELLRSFVSVVDSGGFTRAGERVHRTQSTVSQQIKRLEDDVGQPLLNRTAKDVTPTEAGERLLSYARRLLSLAEEAADVMARPGHEGAVRLGIPEDFAAYRLTKLLATFSRVLALLTAALAGIAGISLTVAGVGIMNVMLVSVSERTREIGLLKALGVTGRQVVAAFLVEAAILSTAGGLAGLGAAFGATRLFRALYPGFPARAPDWAVGAAVGVSLAVGLLFGALPARRASRLDPIAALARR